MTTNEQVIEKFEKNHGKTDESSKSAYEDAHQEVYELLKKDENGSLRKSINEQFKDSTNRNEWLGNVELVGFDKADGDLRFKDSKGNFVDVDKDGNKKAILGGDKDGNGGREFTTDAQGNIVSYNVKKGDTVWSIAETICNERNKGTNKPPTAQEIQAESKKLVAANPELKDPDKIYEGKTVIKVSLESSQEISKKRNPDSNPEADKNKAEIEKNVDLAKKALDKFSCEDQSWFSWGDRGGYNSMTRNDIDEALKRKDLTEDDKKGLEFLKKNYDALETDCTVFTDAVYHDGLDQWKAKELEKLNPTKAPCTTEPKSTAMTESERTEMYKNIDQYGLK